MYLIQQQIAAVRLLHQARFILARSGKRPLSMTKQVRREQFRVMGIFRTVKIDQRRQGACGVLAGKTVHQFSKEGFTNAGRSGQQHMQPVGVKHCGAAFFYCIAQAAIVANQTGKGIVDCVPFLTRQQIGNRTYFTFGVIQLTPQQRFQRLTVQEKHRAAPAFNRQTIIAELIEIFTDRVARQPEVKANGFRRKCRLLRQIGKIQPARQPFEFPQYYLNPSHLFTA
ncbi:hypothetical protein HMPREF0208_04136 [Citrobacter koseri]|nr:hypothetical protein HMPREF0208_04136 [Citrobacter koseri]